MFPYAYIQTHAHRVFTYTKQKYSLQILIEHFQNSTREYCIWYHIYIISKWICVNELAPSHHLYYVSNFLALFVVVSIFEKYSSRSFDEHCNDWNFSLQLLRYGSGAWQMTSLIDKIQSFLICLKLALQHATVLDASVVRTYFLSAEKYYQVFFTSYI